MTINEAMEARHAVRAYTDREIDGKAKEQLLRAVEEINAESGLHIQLVFGEPKAFSGMMARYGKFSGVTDYIALVGKKSPELEEKCGYYGEKLVLLAQTLGLNSCWVAMTYGKVKEAYKVGEGEKLLMVISLGYGETQGVPHNSKPEEEVAPGVGSAPEWFRNGVKAALLAPTAMNQQKFTLVRNGNTVAAKAGSGFYTKTDLGIVKYHFELGAGRENFQWG